MKSVPVTEPINAIYVSYDGALDPLGGTQVVPYLRALSARGVRITLVTFEKQERWLRPSAVAAMRSRLEASDIQWRPLRYHKSPRLLATLYDLWVGSRMISSELARSRASLVHCRGDIAMTMARRAGVQGRARLLYDVRGLFSDERVEAGSWSRGGMVDRVVRRLEAENLQAADGVVVLTALTEAALTSRRPKLPPRRIIPTSADLSIFTPRGAEEMPEYGLVYSGSLGSWYMIREMVAFARRSQRLLPERPLFLTPQVTDAREAGATPDWADTRSADPTEVPQLLCRARAALFFIKPTPAKRASCPTKLAEALACGLPVVCNRGIGDLDEIVERENVGVLVESMSESGYDNAVDRLARLIQDPEVPARCRRLAESRYNLETAAQAYHQLYREIA